MGNTSAEHVPLLQNCKVFLMLCVLVVTQQEHAFVGSGGASVLFSTGLFAAGNHEKLTEKYVYNEKLSPLSSMPST